MKIYPLIEHLLVDHKLSLDKSIQDFSEEKIKYLKLFIDFVCHQLELKEPCDVILVNDREKYNINTGGYNPLNNKIYIYCKNRLLVDIDRTAAHELKHQEQRELGLLTPESGMDGDKFENEANAFAGLMNRKFNKKYPIVYEL